jgi:2-enoate reductase
MHKELFSPIKIGNLNVKNKIVMAPMGNINMADPIGRPLQKMISYFEERAKGGTGLIISGLVPVSFGIDPTISEENNTTYFPRIDGSSRTRMSGWRDLVSTLHSYDSKFFIQLTAGLGRVGSPECALKLKLPKSASFNRNFYLPAIPHFPFTDMAIKKIVKSFGQSAINAKVCGADGIHLHGHEGYLMDQLTSLPWNRRKFGRYKNRFQFAIDIVKEIKNICGNNFPVIYRVDLTQGLEFTYGKEIFKKRFMGMERTIEEGLKFCKELYNAGVDAFDVDKGCYDNWFFPHPPAYFKDMPYVEEMAGSLKKFFEKENINAPVIAVGKLGNPKAASDVIKNKTADMIMLGRPLLADPYWPEKVRTGKSNQIVHCIGDQDACIQSFILGGHPCCSINPYAGFEDVKILKPADKIKNVAVAGAGPGGCEAAITAVKRGHKVTLFEKGDNIGGQFYLASKMQIKHDVKIYLTNLENRLKALEEKGLEIKLNTKPSKEELISSFDSIICATGVKPLVLNIKGLENIPYTDSRTFLEKDLELNEKYKKITIIGGGIVGCELACEMGAKYKDIEITVIEMEKDLMKGVVQANRAMLLWLMMGLGSTDNTKNPLIKNPVKAYTSSKAVEITKNSVIIEANKKRKDPFTPWHTLIPENIHNPFDKKLNINNTEKIEIDTDFIIFATGALSENSLYTEISNSDFKGDIFTIGDSREPASGWQAISSGNDVARFI